MRTIEALIQIAGDEWLHCVDPAHVIEARHPEEINALLDDAEQVAGKTRSFAVGFVSYEAASAFGLAVRRSLDSPGLPLAWFAFFPESAITRLRALPEPGGSYVLGALSPSVDRAAFNDAFARIKSLLAAGDTYQVDYTFRMRGSFSGVPRALFSDLVAAQGGAHSAYIDLGTYAICSASPELFFERKGRRLVVRPMKGTAPRGRTLAEDHLNREHLRTSPKQRAENVMIVDMMRNDLGRVAAVGTVEASELFAVERYPTVWQMTSLVTAESTASLREVFAALHPSASVTGAPKVRTMEVLRDLELDGRGIYTGAVGHIAPNGDAHFNVAIRTAVVERASGSIAFGIGSGIVWDSVVADEYEECLLKAAVLGRRPIQFDLLETTRWTREGGFLFLERHLRRLAESAEYFGYPCDLPGVRAALESLDVELRSTTGEPRRTRLLVGAKGEIRAEHHPVAAAAEPLRVALAAQPVDPGDPFLFHKTTNRRTYEGARASRPDLDEVILWNAAGEVTEAATANVVAELDGGLVTPPVACGLLAGTCRAEALESGRISEQAIKVADLSRATRIWLLNSVYEWREATLVRDEFREKHGSAPHGDKVGA